ncbi:aminotransferase class V-fold PLP-dependent enzyme [Anaerovorax sp. IOR16]|uniref:aminotransferase class V-fold PLP-dependent enzyme n=1 Tax=Anaerovorax sp. IOR16 TaxID=2773458 RepID=UPI0019D10314|nr:aminotransferase class V-fold PLP-dependent enzyme [Anaerovorax sp. IOR16]
MIYLDNAATTFPKPTVSLRAINQCMTSYCGNPGRSGHDMSMKTGEEVYKTRKEIQELFQVEDASHILFTSNATDSLNLAIKGTLKSGDHVITTSMEHNSVLRPLKSLEKEGVQISIIYGNKEGKINPELIRSEIRENTKMIACTHASNVTGTILPIKAIGQIAKENKLIFLVDASQSAGCIPINVNEMNIDLLAMPGHKGLLGPLGTGVLYVNPKLKLKHLKEGGTGTNSRDVRQPYDYPEGYESGTVNAPGIIGLGRSVAFVKKIGVNKIREYEENLISILHKELSNQKNIIVYGPKNIQDKVGIFTFNIKGMECEQVAQELNDKYHIAVRAGFHCAGLAHKTIDTLDIGAVRMSVGPFNQPKEIKYVAQAIKEINKNNLR